MTIKTKLIGFIGVLVLLIGLALVVTGPSQAASRSQENSYLSQARLNDSIFSYAKDRAVLGLGYRECQLLRQGLTERQIRAKAYENENALRAINATLTPAHRYLCPRA